MHIIGLTGGIAMGKSAAADLLAQRGWTVIDTDLIAREVVEPGQPAVAEILQRFGPEAVDPRGSIKRDILARIVFSDPAKRRELEQILHPRIRQRWRARVQQLAGKGGGDCVVVIPLLYETAAQSEFQTVLCIACSEITQRARLRHRGLTSEQIEQRIHAQYPVEKKMLLADFVVWTEGTLDLHAAQLDRILSSL